MTFRIFEKGKNRFDFNVLHTCRTCGNQFRGRFCNICSEKVIEQDEYSFLNFIHNLVSAFTPFEGKFLNSVGLMIRLPGQLSRNIADGIRVPYMKMISFFLLANFFYFVIPTWDTFNSPLNSHMHVLPHQEKARRIVGERLEQEGISIQEFEKKFNAQSTDLSKLLLIILPITFTVVFYLLSISFRLKVVDQRRRLAISFRPRFFEQMLLSMELYSYHIIVNLLIVSGIVVGIVKLAAMGGLNWRSLVMDDKFFLIVVATVVYFFSVSQFTFYKQKWYWALPKVFILLVCFRGIVSLYRHLLFYATMWTV